LNPTTLAVKKDSHTIEQCSVEARISVAYNVSPLRRASKRRHRSTYIVEDDVRIRLVRLIHVSSPLRSGV